MTDFFNIALSATTFMTLITVPDPFGTIPVLLGLTSRMTPKGQKRAALQVTAVSVSVVLTFAVLGQQILHLLHAPMKTLRLFGGVLFFLVAMELLTGLDSEEFDIGDERMNIAFVLLEIPLLAGPGVIAAVMVSVTQANNPITSWIGLVYAVTVAHFVIWVMVHFLLILSCLSGPGEIVLLTRIMDLLLAVIATRLVMGGIFDLIVAT